MVKLSLVFIASLTPFVTAAPSSTLGYNIHERRSPNTAWIASEVELDSRAILPLSIGLMQRNLENGHDFLMDISDPTSPNYGKHWSAEKVAETFAPSQDTVDAVLSWLAENGIGEERVKLSKGSNWVRVNSTVQETEALLKTKYKVYISCSRPYSHSDTCNSYLNIPRQSNLILLAMIIASLLT
jgi:tripeptidyl-peptidase-1